MTRLPLQDAPPPLAYGIEERPSRWWECLLYGWQHTLVDISPFVLPLALAAALGMSQTEESNFINFCLLSMGLATLLQTTWGNRLPIIQGPSATLTGTLVPVASQLGAGAMWGGVLAGALVETAVGASRLLSRLRRLLPPAVSGMVVLCIGASLGELALRLSIGDGSRGNLLLSGGVIALVFLLRKVGTAWAGDIVSRGSIFFSILAVGLGLSSLLGLFRWDLVAAKPWLALPSLFPWGSPASGWTFPLAAILAVLAGYAGSIAESIGDYAATCSVTEEPLRERHINRGILAEGLGCVVASCLGGIPCTSYTQNIGIIAATRVASRAVVQTAALILILYGLCPKSGALLVAMPRSVLGGVFILVCGMIALSGARLIQEAEKTRSNILIVATGLVVSLGVPLYCRFVLDPARLEHIPQWGRMALTNSVILSLVVGVSLNFFLNILRGSPAPRSGA